MVVIKGTGKQVRLYGKLGYATVVLADNGGDICGEDSQVYIGGLEASTLTLAPTRTTPPADRNVAVGLRLVNTHNSLVWYNDPIVGPAWRLDGLNLHEQNPDAYTFTSAEDGMLHISGKRPFIPTPTAAMEGTDLTVQMFSSNYVVVGNGDKIGPDSESTVYVGTLNSTHGRYQPIGTKPLHFGGNDHGFRLQGVDVLGHYIDLDGGEWRHNREPLSVLDPADYTFRFNENGKLIVTAIVMAH